MKFVFNENLDYQINAVNSVISLFDGQPYTTPLIEIREGGSIVPVVGNKLDLNQEAILENLEKVQEEGNLRKQPEVYLIDGPVEVEEGEFEDTSFYNFSIEMETGTGKTYVYIRTILELGKRYGMRKFIVVVPSIAIKEGTLKSLDITREHFRSLYGSLAYDFYEYSPGRLRGFADSSDIQVMVMTLPSFNKDMNVIYRTSDQLFGEAGINYVRAARPILILDEPQNMESKRSTDSFLRMKPLMALRYSATHRKLYNNIYRLTPWQAYDMRLVKRIEVASVVDVGATVDPYIEVRGIQAKGKKVTAKAVVEVMDKSNQLVRKQKTLKLGMDLEELTGHHAYDGYIVAEISRHSDYVQFENGLEIGVGEVQGGERGQVFEKQIEYAIAEHFRKQERLKDRGIKVLTLFFIDRVDNYISDDGIIKKLFDEAFNRLKSKYDMWKDLEPEDIRSGYFAKKKVGGVEEFVDSKTGESKKDEEAYNLIMKEKEILLSFPTESDDEETKRKKKVAFIFSHSALREGWDNPNVFQICTLNQTTSQIKKRQEVGRGIRLCVDQDGNRVMDERINILTVVANESYVDYVRTLQLEFDKDVYDVYRTEIEVEYGKDISELTDAERKEVMDKYGAGIVPPPPKNVDGDKALLQESVVLSTDFAELWDRIKHKTRYRVKIGTGKLIGNVVDNLNAAPIPEPKIEITKAAIVLNGAKVKEEVVGRAKPTAIDLAEGRLLPSIVDIIEENLGNSSPPLRITRKTILEMFKRSSRKEEALKNPYGWASVATRLIRNELADQISKGISYTKNGEHFDLSLITDESEVDLFQAHKVTVDTSKKKSVYSVVGCDSNVEEQFVVDLEKRDDVAVYIKLPPWFQVPTPLGNYNPDWAILMKDETTGEIEKLYLVSETKGPGWEDSLRMKEEVKVYCAAAHFGSKQYKKKGALEDVDYKVVIKAEELP